MRDRTGTGLLRTLPARPPLDPLPEAASLLLDILRFGLALAVVAGHATLPWFAPGWPSLLAYANLAVPVFFVLSGFMIRYVTETRERDAPRYWISRASRIFSVVLPACALTILADAISHRVNPGVYRQAAGTLLWQHFPWHLMAHLIFYTQFWGHSVLLLSNLPLWSLGYEVPYYILFGLMTFLRGPSRWLTAALTVVFFGPQVLLLLPIWWSGCWLYDLWQWSRTRPGRMPQLSISVGCTLVLVLLHLPIAGETGFFRIANLPNPLELLHQRAARAIMFEFSGGLLAWSGIYLALTASGVCHLPKNTAWARAIRRVADSTFTIYLFHFPLLVLASSLGVYRPDSTPQKLSVLGAIVLLSVLAAVPIDRLKRWLRHTLERAYARHARKYRLRYS